MTKEGDRGLEHLAACQNLTHLNLSETRVSDAGLMHLGTLKKLTLLNLTHTRVTDRGLNYIAKLSSLKELYLDSSGGTDAGQHELEALKNLTALGTRCGTIDRQGIPRRLQGIQIWSIAWNAPAVAMANDRIPDEVDRG